MHLKLALAIMHESFETCDNEIVAAAHVRGWIAMGTTGWILTTQGKTVKQGLYNSLAEKIRKSLDS